MEIPSRPAENAVGVHRLMRHHQEAHVACGWGWLVCQGETPQREAITTSRAGAVQQATPPSPPVTETLLWPAEEAMGAIT